MLTFDDAYLTAIEAGKVPAVAQTEGIDALMAAFLSELERAGR